MEQQSNNNSTCQRPQRAQSIPKVVNNFIIANYGFSYYSTESCEERMEILKQIESKLNSAGYNISWSEVERRMKNMKSHYRLKKRDLDNGTVQTVEWDYYEALAKIFTLTDQIESDEKTKKAPTKRKLNSSPKETKQDEEPQDLTVKRPKVISFNSVGEIAQQIEAKDESKAKPSRVSSKLKAEVKASSTAAVPTNAETFATTVQNIVQSIRAVDEHRLALDQQRVGLELRRYELDVLGNQLSELLYKLTQPPQTN